MPEMILTATDNGRERRKRGDVTTQVTTVSRIMLIGLDHHRHGIPPDVTTDLGFKLHAARMAWLLAHGDRVQVSRVR